MSRDTSLYSYRIVIVFITKLGFDFKQFQSLKRIIKAIISAKQINSVLEAFSKILFIDLTLFLNTRFLSFTEYLQCLRSSWNHVLSISLNLRNTLLKTSGIDIGAEHHYNWFFQVKMIFLLFYSFEPWIRYLDPYITNKTIFPLYLTIHPLVRNISLIHEFLMNFSVGEKLYIYTLIALQASIPDNPPTRLDDYFQFLLDNDSWKGILIISSIIWKNVRT